jgi:hypothetical protein
LNINGPFKARIEEPMNLRRIATAESQPLLRDGILLDVLSRFIWLDQIHLGRYAAHSLRFGKSWATAMGFPRPGWAFQALASRWKASSGHPLGLACELSILKKVLALPGCISLDEV